VNVSKNDDLRQVMTGPPAGYFVVVPQSQAEDVVNLATIFRILADSWKVLMSAALFGAIITAVISLQMRSLYRAEILVAPVNRDRLGGLNALGNQVGGLAALVGVDVGTSGGKEEEWFATLTSTGFARSFILSENLMPILFAKGWDSRTSRWREDEKQPTLEAAVKLFTRSVRTITQDRKTGLVTVSVEWYSPQLAALWANRMVDMVNERLRTEAISNADLSIAYLNKELAKTNVVEMQQAIYRLIENQVNSAMLANVEHEYAFRVIDPAVAPETRVSPKRTVMTLVGGAVGLFVAVIFVFSRRALRAALHVDTSTRRT
jgi:LPS O-antigen subunit length determinant protein (WzzB/FepE family)